MLLPIGFWAQDKRRCVVNGEKIAFKLQHLFRLSPIHNEGAKLSGSNAKGLTVQSPNERPVNNADKPMILLKFLALINCSCVMYLQLLGGFQLRKSGKLGSDLKEERYLFRIPLIKKIPLSRTLHRIFSLILGMKSMSNTTGEHQARDVNQRRSISFIQFLFTLYQEENEVSWLYLDFSALSCTSTCKIPPFYIPGL